MRKEAVVPERCQTIAVMQRIIGGKWKLEILYYIGFENVHRFGGLRRHIGGISESSLTTQLRELEADGFIHRHDYKEIPPRVFPDRTWEKLYAGNGISEGLGRGKFRKMTVTRKVLLIIGPFLWAFLSCG